MKKMLLMVAAVALMMPMQAMADSKGKTMMDKMDVNGDGAVSKQEYMDHSAAKAEKKFAKMDVNGDGVISKDEAKDAKKDKKDKKKEKKDSEND